MKTYNDEVTFTESGGIYLSEPFKLDSIYGVAVSCKWAGESPVGIYKIQVSVHPIPTESDWYDLPASVKTLQEQDCVLFDMHEVFYSRLRLYIQVQTGSLDTVSARINSKGV